MGCSHESALKNALTIQLKDVIRAGVAVCAGHFIHLFIFTEGSYARCKDYELAAVLDDHPCAVNALVAYPCGLEFSGLKIGDDFFSPSFHMEDVEFLREGGSIFKWSSALTDIQPPEGDLLVFARRDGLQVDHRNNPVHKMLLSIVIQLSCRTVSHAQSLFHTADRTQHVRFVDHFTSAGSDEYVLGVVGHTHHLVRNDLSD